jgi:hypothetical protein
MGNRSLALAGLLTGLINLGENIVSPVSPPSQIKIFLLTPHLRMAELDFKIFK